MSEHPVGEVDVALEPEQKYFWRVATNTDKCCPTPTSLVWGRNSMVLETR